MVTKLLAVNGIFIAVVNLISYIVAACYWNAWSLPLESFAFPSPPFVLGIEPVAIFPVAIITLILWGLAVFLGKTGYQNDSPFDLTFFMALFLSMMIALFIVAVNDPSSIAPISQILLIRDIIVILFLGPLVNLITASES